MVDMMCYVACLSWGLAKVGIIEDGDWQLWGFRIRAIRNSEVGERRLN